MKSRSSSKFAFYSLSFSATAFLMVAASCAHQNDDDFPVRHPGKSPELVSPPIPPPTAPQPTPAPPPPLVTLPAPSAPVKPTPAPTAKVQSTGTSAPKATASTGPVSGALQLSDPLSAPVRRLINSAEESLKKGKILEARAQADRAYRMNLRDPRTSFLMARVSEREKSYDDAEQWARRSLETLSDASNKRVVWNFISQVRSKNGNKKGAQEAARQANELR